MARCWEHMKSNKNNWDLASESDVTSPHAGEKGMRQDLDQKEEALVAYDQAIQLAPNEASFHYHKAHVLEQLGRLSEANRAYEEAQRLEHNA